METFSIPSLAQDLKTEGDAYRFLEDLRWRGRPVCPHCGATAAYFLTPRNGDSRATRTGAKTERRLWKCRSCRKQFSVITNTVMHGTKVPIRTWVFVLLEMVASKNGVAAREIERKYRVTPRTAWHMTCRIREAMKSDPLASLFSGVVEADEMYVGPRQRGKGSGMDNKVPVVTLVERGGRARSVVAQDNTGATLVPLVARSVEPGTAVVTDSWRGYADLHHFVAKHEQVNHGIKEWARGEWTTNSVEGFFGQVRRSISGTHHQVTNKHVARYMAEFDFRYSTRKSSDSKRLATLISQVGGKRLTYDELRGRSA